MILNFESDLGHQLNTKNNKEPGFPFYVLSNRVEKNHTCLGKGTFSIIIIIIIGDQ